MSREWQGVSSWRMWHTVAMWMLLLRFQHMRWWSMCMSFSPLWALMMWISSHKRVVMVMGKVVVGEGKLCLYLCNYKLCWCLVMRTSWDQLDQSFVGLKNFQLLETEDWTTVVVFDSPRNFQSLAVLVQSSLGLFPVLGLDFQALLVALMLSKQIHSANSISTSNMYSWET